MLPDLHIGFSRGRSGGLVFPSLSEFSTVYCDPHSQGFGIVNKAEIDVFLELSCFFHDPADVGNLISGSSAFPNTSLNIWKFTVHVLLKPRSGEQRLRQGTGARWLRRLRRADHGLVVFRAALGPFPGLQDSHFLEPGRALGASAAFPVAFWPPLLLASPS